MRKLALSVLILCLSACARHTYSTADGRVTIDQKGKDASSMKFTGRDGKQVSIDMNTGSMPPDYPKDVPVYKDAKVVISQTMSEKNGRHIMLETADPAAKIVDYYKKELDANGWKTEASMDLGAMSMITADKDKRRLVIQVVGDNDNKRSINQTLADKD
ncbi:MAG: hypothetical protein M3Y07_11005 [Acidobacteriota bacterium]|nr:hypothetical protein [Acidobacteriota bacterium]